jgi:hypothetical protein
MPKRQATLDLASKKSGDSHPYEPFSPGPNPKLADFVREQATPYDPATDHYDVPAFDRDLVINKAAAPRAIQNMHRYWSKKHWSAIREYIKHYLPVKHYPRGTGLVLDCFSGSGMTGVAAMMEDRPCVLIDASPAAAFISHCYTHPVDPDELQAAYERMLSEPYPSELRAKLRKETGNAVCNLQEELDWLYATKCDRCGGDATTEYVVYSQRFQCPNCAEIIPLVDCPQEKVSYPVGGKKSGKTELKKKTVCPHCLARNHGKPHRDFVISTRGDRFGQIPVLVHYRCEAGCRPPEDERRHDEDRRSRKARFFSEYDLAKIERIERAQIPHWYPSADLWKALPYRLGHKKDFRPTEARDFADLYTKRNLWALAAINAQEGHETLRLGITATSIGLSRMQGYSPGSTFPNMIISGTYYIPPNSKEYNASEWYQGKVKSLVAAENALCESLIGISQVSNEGTANSLLESSVDYVFIDPAYVDKVQYGELNFIWESWLGFDNAWLKDEIVVNPFRHKSIDDWDRDLRSVLAKLHQALKPGRWLSLCYHDTDPGTWARVQDMLLDTGFEIHTVTVLDPLQKSSNQLTAEKVAKGDLVVNCRKPRPGEAGRAARDEAGLVSERVRDILLEVLSQAAGQTREHLWDLVLKRLLARGQLAAHRFGDILAEVAFRSESGRWFLKEELEHLSDDDVKNEEHAGAGLTAFARLRAVGVPAAFAAEIVLHAPRLAGDDVDEDDVEDYVRQNLLKGRADAEKFKLGGRLKGVEFYDCLFFYLTRWLKGRAAGKTPRRNLAEFLDEYLVHFKDGDKWLYRLPDEAEAASLKKARRTGLGRRIRQYVAFLQGAGEFPSERRPDVKTLFAWLKHCASFGLAEEGVALFEKGGLAAQLGQLPEEERWDAEDYYAQCRRRAGRPAAAGTEDEEGGEEGSDSSED